MCRLFKRIIYKPLYLNIKMKKRGLLVLVLVLTLIFLSLLYVSAQTVECNDFIDNDGDGLIDGLIELNSDNNKTLKVNTDPFGDIATSNIDGVMEAVAKNISNKKMSYSLKWINGYAIIRKQGSTIHTTTLNKVCNVLGYKNVLSHACVSPPYENRCNFVSPGDNYLWIFDSTINNFRAIGATGNEWLSEITCEDRLPECSDGWDNDKDGEIDYPNDTGCFSPNDDSELPHDPGCFNLNDTVENDTAPACSDGMDNDNDSLIDYPNDPGCCSISDINEVDNLPQCSDGCDNDNDTFVDMDDPECKNPDWDDESKPPLSLNVSHWANMLNEPIARADLNDSVKLIVRGDFLTGEIINYEIYKENAIFWIDIKVNEGKTQGFYIWRAGKKQDGSFSEGDYYFKARINRTNNNETDSRYLANGSDNPYGILSVGPKYNDNPRIRIISPENKQIYFLNELLNFTFIIEDEDDQFFAYDITLGELGERRTGLSQGIINFNYSYKQTAQKIIFVTVTDERGGKSDEFISILIIDSTESKYVFSYIDSPVRGAFISGRNVTFDATSSYAIDEVIESNGTRILTCLSGFCPLTTKGCPPDYNISNCPIVVNNAPNDSSLANYTLMYFTWKFDGPQGFEETCSEEQGCDELFSKLFSVPGNYLATLNISINPSSSISVSFDTTDELRKPVSLSKRSYKTNNLINLMLLVIIFCAIALLLIKYFNSSKKIRIRKK